MKKSLILICLISSCMHINAQLIRNSYIVDLKKGTGQSFESLQRQSIPSQGLEIRELSSTLDIIQITSPIEGDQALEKWLNNNPNVESWGYNCHVQKRKTPNDQYFDLQWGLKMINAVDAWEVTTGGNDINGREIVVAVLDDGYDLDHPELEGRIYTNEAEIPDDGIDNDNNGYVDDFRGWNSTDGNDNHPITDNHGIAVCGIIGAKTNNELGVAAINWQVKILPISGIATQAEVIAGYQYVLNMRKRYNETDGAEGAYIVVTNYSAGIDNAFGTAPQYKSWCDMYEAMGDQGILSVGATANKNVNVDTDGDMPTTCPSSFLVAVTNTDMNDTKVVGAGFGLENIDLGAPGAGTLVLDLNDGFDQNFGGTSASTPHVAGAIALLYSAPCNNIAALATQNPRQAAEIIRDALYNGTSPNSTLDGITVTGGRLDIFGALQELVATCEIVLPSPNGDLSIERINRESLGSFLIDYITPDNNQYSAILTDRIGRTIRHIDFTPPSVGRKQLRLNIPDLIP
ncbi:MAG: S8 family serine peptidase, partial [Bacteroidota bacterium]